jgi:HD-like signal output (HDOD) protein
MASLPSIPRRYAALSAALDRLDAPIREVASVVEKDVAMAAKVLQLVNSSFFGLPHRVANIENAVSYLGTNTLRNLLLSVEVFETLSGSGVERVRFSESLARHSRLAAGIARGLLPDRRQAEDAFTAALLHDIGSLVLLSHLPEAYSRISREASMTGCPLLDAELHVLGTTHAEIGAYLLGIWGLPCPIVEAVAHHHAPGRVEHERFDGLSAVYVANALAHHVADVGAAPAAEPVAGLDLAYLRRLGVDGQLGAWREMAIAVARAEPEGT